MAIKDSEMSAMCGIFSNGYCIFYNLDAIISVGYRVNSQKVTNFRIWATKILNEYIRKGFVLDDDRLKQGSAVFGQDYFLRALERTVTSYFDYIESKIERGNVFNMEQFAASINKFLTFNDYKILTNKGSVSAREAKEKA